MLLFSDGEVALFGGVFPPVALILLAALALDALLGEMNWLTGRIGHPVVWIGKLIGWLDGRLNRAHRSPASRRNRGALVALFVTGLAGGIGWLIHAMLPGGLPGGLIEAFLAALLISQRSLFSHVNDVARALDQGLASGRAAVARIVGRDPAQLDSHGVSRAAIESCAENFSDGVVAPAFWFLILGLPGIAAYKALNTLDSMIGHRNERYEDFGKVSAIADDLANFIPARLSGVLLSLAACFIPHGKPVTAFRTMLRDAGRHRSPNAGWPEAAAAGALDLALAGPRRYGETVVDDAWMGDGRARATSADIRRMLALFLIACLILAGFVAVLAAYAG